MRIYINFRPVRGPYGGANAFLRALTAEFGRLGIRVVRDPGKPYDVALLNALTLDIDVEFVARVAERGAPIVHRKVGYRASGSSEMRAVGEDGAVHGDVLQLEFTPYVAHSIFQSAYSRDVFIAAGFEGPHSVVHNGVDESIFHQRRRTTWNRREPLRIAVSTWSTDMLKGFDDYLRIDSELEGRHDVEVTLYGRAREDARFRNIREGGAHRRRPLARRLRSSHALLQLARWETCSNALLEGINCGLPPIYLDSGSNKEIAEPYGVEFRGDFSAAVDELRDRYDELQARTRANPYRMPAVARRYVEILESVR